MTGNIPNGIPMSCCMIKPAAIGQQNCTINSEKQLHKVGCLSTLKKTIGGLGWFLTAITVFFTLIQVSYEHIN